MSQWVQVLLDVGVPEVEVVSDSLWAAGVAGIEERPSSDDQVTLVAGLDASSLAEVRAALGDRPFDVVEVAADAGLDGWREFAQPITVGAVTVVPSWLDAPANLLPGSIVVRLDAGRSFGHGAHVTTRLALELLQRVVDPSSSAGSVLDVGSGSGVLSVVGAKLGAIRVVAVDIDPEAVTAGTANVRLNGVGGVVEVVAGSLDALRETDAGDPEAFALVVANIEAPILIELAEAIIGRICPGGQLVLSGFLVEQESRVHAAFAPFDVVHRREEDGWVALVLLARPEATAL